MAVLSLVPDPSASAVAEAGRDTLELARAGDARALRWVYDRHAPAVSRFIRGLLRDPHAANDALQETFARAFRNLAGVTDAEHVVPWLLGIARHVAHEHYRADHRSRGSVHSGGESRHELTPELTLVGKQAAEVVERALQAMGEGRRAALLLRVDHGLAYQQIAEVMGWSLAKAKVEVHRGREQLRSALAEAEGEAVP